MLIEIWERLSGYNKWPRTEATIKSSDLAEVEIGRVRYSSFSEGEPVDEWKSANVLTWRDAAGSIHEAEYTVAEDSPLFQLYDGQRISIRYNPLHPDQFYLRGVTSSRIHTWFKKALIFIGNLVRRN
jgi:hypothetical protein